MRSRPTAYGWRRGRAVVLASTVALVVAGCGASVVQVESPTPDGDIAQVCADLVDTLPAALEEGERRDVSPESDYVAAYGNPAVVLRCGVAEPAEYGPTAELVVVNGVEWLPVEQADGVAFYATGRVAWVRVDVPSAYAPGTFALTELSDVVRGLAHAPD